MFTGLTGRPWSDESASLGAEREFRADFYVFAIHTCREPEQYDALDLSRWEFRVLGASVLRKHSYRSITKGSLDSIAPRGLRLDELAQEIERTFSEDQARR